jgi:predicted RNA-binding Zn-ribbon protein involved in translation (DUF1610 family)
MNHQKIYESIIQKARVDIREKGNGVYYERRHILPKCLGGNNKKENIILLTAKEHYLCHKLLTHIYKGDRKIACAFYYMSYNKKHNYVVSARDYAYARELINSIPVSKETCKKISKALKGKPGLSGERNGMFGKGYLVSGEKNPFYNKTHTDEQCKKWSEERTGVTFTEEHKNNLSKALSGEGNPMFGLYGENNPNFGSKRTEESKQKMKGRKKSPEEIEKIIQSNKNQPKYKCPHCGKEMTNMNYKKWHGDKCKYKINV